MVEYVQHITIVVIIIIITIMSHAMKFKENHYFVRHMLLEGLLRRNQRREIYSIEIWLHAHTHREGKEIEKMKERKTITSFIEK